MITVLVFYITGEACLAYTYEIILSLQLNGLYNVKWSSTHTFQGIIFNEGRAHEVIKILAGVVICVCYKNWHTRCTSRWQTNVFNDHAKRICLKGIGHSSALQRLEEMVDIPMKKKIYSSLVATTRRPLVFWWLCINMIEEIQECRILSNFMSFLKRLNMNP